MAGLVWLGLSYVLPGPKSDFVLVSNIVKNSIFLILKQLAELFYKRQSIVFYVF
jgi:hypothetical protein